MLLIINKKIVYRQLQEEIAKLSAVEKSFQDAKEMINALETDKALLEQTQRNLQVINLPMNPNKFQINHVVST